MPILPGLLRHFAGADGRTSLHDGAMLALCALMQCLCAPILGASSDRFGRRPALQATLSAQVDESRQGELQGTRASIASLIGVAGPLVATAGFAATRAASGRVAEAA